MHVTKSLGPYDVIIHLRFSDEVIEWDGAEMPFKDGDASTKDAHCVADGDPVEDVVHRVKKILDAKYDKADIEKICEEQAELDKGQRAQLAVLLGKFINDNSSPEIRPQTSDEIQQRQCLKQSFLTQCFTKRIDAFTCKFETYEHCTTTETAPCLSSIPTRLTSSLARLNK